MNYVMVQTALMLDDEFMALPFVRRGFILSCVPYADPATGICATSIEGLKRRVNTKAADRFVLKWLEEVKPFLEATAEGAYRLTDRVIRRASSGPRAHDDTELEPGAHTNGHGPRTAAEKQAEYRERVRIREAVADQVAALREELLASVTHNGPVLPAAVTDTAAGVTPTHACAPTTTNPDSDTETKRESTTTNAADRVTDDGPGTDVVVGSGMVVDVVSVRKRLLAAGLHPKQADEVLAFDPGECVRQLDFLADRPPGIRNPAAYLLTAIRERKPAPGMPEVRPAKSRADLERERIVRELYCLDDGGSAADADGSP